MPRKTPRLGLNAAPASVGATTGDASDTTGAELTGTEASAEEGAYQASLEADRDLAAQPGMSERTFDANAVVPAAVSENVNPRTRAKFAPPSQTRSMSNYARRIASRDTHRVMDAASQARTRSYESLRNESSREAKVGSVNEALRRVNGDQRRLPPNLRRRQQDLDRTIRAAERGNTREHTVYVAADMSGLPGSTPQQKIAAAQDLIQNGEGAYSVQGYMVGAQDMADAVNEGNNSEVVMEIKTDSGIYLGNSDGETRDSTHLIGRNRRLMPVAVHNDVPYQRPDGTIGRRTVIQMKDVTPDVWAATHQTPAN